MYDQSGFTLVETLVALGVLAVGAVGLIGAAEEHTKRIGRLESRTIAQWVAENELAELRLAGGNARESDLRVTMLGRDWRVFIASRNTTSPGLVGVDISVSAAGTSEPLIVLSGFVDAG